MRTIIFTRGLMGSGKSTFLKEIGLEDYAISSDKIRLLMSVPRLGLEKNFTISQNNHKEVFELIRELVEKRMSNRELVVIDATNIELNHLESYKKLCKTYRYSAYIVDFSNVSLKDVKERNKKRKYIVPEYAIDRASKKLKKEKISENWIKVIEPSEFYENLKYETPDLSHWKKIHHIGDIHGCGTVLEEYLNAKLNEDELYIFVGDYIDRGIENEKTLDILNVICQKPNVILLEGNHERYLKLHSFGLPIKNESFNKYTLPEIRHMDVKKLRTLYRKLRTFIKYKYNEKTVLVSHGGLSYMPKDEEIFTIPENEFIKGMGDYETKISEYWNKQSKENEYQVHGHRNKLNLPIMHGTRNFILEGKIELGGKLRVLTLDENGFEEKYIQNNVYNTYNTSKSKDIDLTPADFLNYLQKNSLIKEKKFNDNISSFNFSRDVFYEGLWDLQTIKARGLFINTNTLQITARSYNKFFNTSELLQNPELIENNLEKHSFIDFIKFPLKSYIKENGFLGITGYNSEFKKPVVVSKSSVTSVHKNWFEDILKDTLKEKYDMFFLDLEKHNLSAVFEVIDIKNDVHTIGYPKSICILLDLIKREQKFNKLNYKDLLVFGKKYGLKIKKAYEVFDNKEEFLKFYKESQISDKKIEGYVLEDANGFMFKLKLPYYKFWNKMGKNIEKYNKLNKEESSVEKYDNFFNYLSEKEIEVFNTIVENKLLDNNIVEIQEYFNNNN